MIPHKILKMITGIGDIKEIHVLVLGAPQRSELDLMTKRLRDTQAVSQTLNILGIRVFSYKLDEIYTEASALFVLVWKFC